MAFSFGNKSPAPAPAFGAPAAPTFGAAPSGGFGGAAPAPFGAAPAPFGSAGGSLFGAAPPASSGGFGAASKPGGLFGSPSPAPGGLFGSAPTPAPGGLFGTTSAPAQGGLFGSQPAPAPQPPPPSVSSQTPYSQLPPQVKQVIDGIHEQMMQHKRSMAQVQTMAPVLLRHPTQSADAAAGASAPLMEQFQKMAGALQVIESNLQACSREAACVKAKYEQTTTQAVVHGIWPMEALASRKEVKLTTIETKSNPTITEQIRKLLEFQAAHVDRLEKIPSPYIWQALEEMDDRLQELNNSTQLITTYLTQMKNIRDMGVASVVQGQTALLLQVAQQVTNLQHRVHDLRTKYRHWEKEVNVLDQQKVRDLLAQQKRDEIVKIGYLKAASVAPPAPAPAPGAAPAPGGLFGSAPASSGLFGNAPTPGVGFGAAPKPGGLFGSAPAPAPATGGGLFGSTPAAPAPAAGGGGGLFGSTPAAPAPAAGGGLFGSTPAPAPATGGGLFGSTPAAPAPAAGGGLFGSTPAAAEAPTPSGGLFGSTAAPAFGAAPVATGGFGSSSSASKPKNKSRSNRRK